eukprot:3581599-Amphidinium_carterae.1
MTCERCVHARRDSPVATDAGSAQCAWTERQLKQPNPYLTGHQKAYHQPARRVTDKYRIMQNILFGCLELLGGVGVLCLVPNRRGRPWRRRYRRTEMPTTRIEL